MEILVVTQECPGSTCSVVLARACRMRFVEQLEKNSLYRRERLGIIMRLTIALPGETRGSRDADNGASMLQQCLCYNPRTCIHFEDYEERKKNLLSHRKRFQIVIRLTIAPQTLFVSPYKYRGSKCVGSGNFFLAVRSIVRSASCVNPRDTVVIAVARFHYFLSMLYDNTSKLDDIPAKHPKYLDGNIE